MKTASDMRGRHRGEEEGKEEAEEKEGGEGRKTGKESLLEGKGVRRMWKSRRGEEMERGRGRGRERKEEKKQGGGTERRQEMRGEEKGN